MSDSGADVLRRARQAAAGGDWKGAHALLADADASGLVPEAELPWVAEVAYAAGHLDATIEAWERAHMASVRAGDDLSAAGAAIRVALHLLIDTALMAPVRGWLSRAERLIQGREATPVHAWFAVARSYERLLSGDVGAAAEWSRQAVDVGTRLDPAAAAVGRVAAARCQILAGKVHEGLKALDEAGVAMLTGELDPISTGIVYCEVVCALQALAQYDLAEQWTEAMERWVQVSGIGSLHGRCRVHRAEILRLRGSCAEAEEQALVACAELRPYLRRELGWPLTELGRIRHKIGDIDGAEEAFLAAHENGWDPEPGLALVHLARGNVAAASSAIRAALAHPSSVPSKELPPNTELRRAPLLEAAVEIELAAGELEHARRAAKELSEIAATFESKALVASAALARARVELAAGQLAEARASFEQAARLWNEIGAPYETALARRGLGETQRSAGDERERAPRTEQPLDRSTAAFRCEGDTWSLTFAGRDVRLRDLKGLRYLARLLAEPGREFHVLELVALEREPPGEDLGDATAGDSGPLLDARAKEAYRRRLGEIEEDIAEATSMADLARIAQAQTERDFLVRELSRAVGLGGRDRRAGSASERARASVTRAVRQALARIREHHEPLADHLERVVRTGTQCAYLREPHAPITWTL
ncbi:MAG TPA: tetratricopeptide repeat protein [Polyangiaceae bacterium]|nr:tetratricopeptide repeat protein [Polyangiaceae bacterium]